MMIRPLRSSLQIALLCGICFVLATATYASNVPELTGYFNLGGFQPGGIEWLGSPPYAAVSIGPPADLHVTSGCYSCDNPNYRVDWAVYDGSMVDGGFSMFAQVQSSDPNPIWFTGSITGGSVSGWTQTVCSLCFGDPINQWTYGLTFRGTWSNGWYSQGSANARLSFNSGEGSIYMTTSTTSPTPEPGTFVLFGSSLLGAVGVLRRRWGK